MSFHGFTGQRTGVVLKSQNFSQMSTFHPVRSFDQFGRQFSWLAENKTGMPKSMLEPMFAAPWHPDPEFIVVNPENTTECYLDLRAFIKSRIEGLREYHAKAVEKADKKGWPIPTMGEYSQDITDSCGRQPRPYQLAVALDQGNPWVMGTSEIPDPRLIKYLEGPTHVIDEVLENFEFGPGSYEQALADFAAKKGPKKAKVERFTSFDALRTATRAAANLDLDDPNAIGLAYGAGEDLDLQLEAEHDSAFDTLTTDSVGDEQLEQLAEANDNANEDLMDLEDEMDPDAIGGRTVAAHKAEGTERKAPPRRPHRKTVATRHAAPIAVVPESALTKAPKPTPAKAWSRAAGRSMADGAVPFIGE